jgi:hypothetical protein
MLKYQFFPRSTGLTNEAQKIINCFEKVYNSIDSSRYKLDSDGVLKKLKPHLESYNYKVEKGKTQSDKIKVPVLFGLNNKIDKYFDADAISNDGNIVIEVEAGRAYTNYQFLKDIFEASMMFGVEYLILAVRNDYRCRDDFSKINTFLETLYISNRIQLPLKGILLVGY